MMDYKERVKLLIERKVIKTEDEVYFPQLGEKYYADLSDFFQKYMEEEYNFEGPIFFFASEDSMNAWASTYNGLNIICINQKALAFFGAIINDNGVFINQYLDQKSIRKTYDNILPAATIMTQLLEMFLFYHEMGHLIQEQKPILFTNFTDEIPQNGEEYSQIEHISEYDADIFAANKLAIHLFLIFDRQENLISEVERKRFLEDLCIVAVTAYSIYRLLLFNGYGDFYTKKYDHPHLVIRINFFILHFTKIISEHCTYPLDNRRILNEAMEFAYRFSNLLPEPMVRAASFFEMGEKHADLIIEHIYELNQKMVSLSSTAHSKMQRNENP